MNKTFLALSVASAALVGFNAYALTPAGERLAAPTDLLLAQGRLEDKGTDGGLPPEATRAPTTPQEREAARAKRNAQGKELGKQDYGRLEDSGKGSGTSNVPAAAKPTTAAEREAARAKRNAEGKELGKQDYGRLEDSGKGSSTSNVPAASKPTTAAERDAARAKRQAAAKEMPRD